MYFLGNYVFIEIFWEKLDYFSCDFAIFDDYIGCATKSHSYQTHFDFPSLLDQKL